MKKIVVFLLLGFASFLLLAGSRAHAEDEIIDLYPYDQQACLEGTTECKNTKVGNSFWSFTYGGYRYHSVRGSVRYVSDFEDANTDGEFTQTEITGISWGSFGSTIINNTAETVVLGTPEGAKNRIALYSGSRHDVSLHFDENGILQMFENAVNTYYIHNDGTDIAPDWRLATQEEIDAYDAATDPATETPNTVVDNIRVKLDDTDSDGYVLERLKLYEMIAEDVDVALDPESAWSNIIDGNPVDILLPSGWTVMSFAYLDRAMNTKNLDFIMDLPSIMISDSVTPLVSEYISQPATFSGLTNLDDDSETPGINIVVEYNGTFTTEHLSTYLDSEDVLHYITPSWVDMFNDSGDVINNTEKLDYSVAISQEDVLLETIDFTYDPIDNDYTASSEIISIDSSVFGAGYKAIYTVETSEGDVTTVEVDIVIGVMPPRFEGVQDRFIDQGIAIDLLEGITADDGYGNDKTDTIKVTHPAGLNIYNPFPGEYQIDVEFTHHVFIPGYDPSYTLNETVYTEDIVHNQVVTDFRPVVALFTDVTNLKTSTFAWNTTAVVMEVSGDGTLIQSINRGAWGSTLINETNPAASPGDGSSIFNDWIANMTLEEGGFVLVVGSGTDGYTQAGTTDFGDPVSYNLDTVPDFNYDIVTTDSYILTVDDMTAPILMVVNQNYSIYAGEYSNVNNAILANVVAYDFTDAQDDLVMYVSNNGGLNVTTPGTYTVEVTVEDAAGHTDVQSFDVVVKEAMLTEADVEALIEENTLSSADVITLIEANVLAEADVLALIEANVLSEEDVQDLIDAGVITEAQIQALIDASLPEDTGCGSAITGTSAIFVTFSLVLGAAAIFFIRKRR